MRTTDLVPLAHGIGGQRDLPIPLNLTIAGAVAALVVSFTVLALAWRNPRYDDDTVGRQLPVLLIVSRTFGMLMFLYTAFVAVFGTDTIINPVFGIFFVILWVGIVPASFVFGEFWKAISPVRTINAGLARLAGTDPEEGLYRYPDRLGMWPGALGLFAFVWFELVYPSSTELIPLRGWMVTWFALMLVGGALFGNRFYANCDPFEVYSSLVAKLSPWARVDGVLVARSPLANLSTLEVRPGLVAVMAVLFGSTGFDSFKDSSRWITYVQSSSINGRFLANVGLLVFILVAGGVFSVATMLTGVHPTVHPELHGRARWVAEVRARAYLPGAFAHSIVPIVLGYIIAHYMSFAFDIGSRTVILMSDPLSNGSDIFGTANLSEIVFWSYHPTALAVTKVLAVVIGHVVAAIAAHDRALHLLPRKHQLTGQLPLLIAMVGFTYAGLFLLFSS